MKSGAWSRVKPDRDNGYPLRVGYHEFIDIGRDVIRTQGLRNKLRQVFGRPGWTPTPLTGERSAA